MTMRMLEDKKEKMEKKEEPERKRKEGIKE